MGIRQTLNDNPAITTAVTGVIIVLALAFAFRSACSNSGSGSDLQAASGKLYFTVDDGQTWFPDDATKVPPFQHQGKTAYRARVFRCPDGTEFVSHLERFPEADRKKLQDQVDAAKAGPGGPAAAAAAPYSFLQAMEVKKPGDKDWVKMTPKTMEQYSEIMTPKCASGSNEGVMQVTPR